MYKKISYTSSLKFKSCLGGLMSWIHYIKHYIHKQSKKLLHRRQDRQTEYVCTQAPEERCTHVRTLWFYTHASIPLYWRHCIIVTALFNTTYIGTTRWTKVGQQKHSLYGSSGTDIRTYVHYIITNRMLYMLLTVMTCTYIVNMYVTNTRAHARTYVCTYIHAYMCMCIHTNTTVCGVLFCVAHQFLGVPLVHAQHVMKEHCNVSCNEETHTESTRWCVCGGRGKASVTVLCQFLNWTRQDRTGIVCSVCAIRVHCVVCCSCIVHAFPCACMNGMCVTVCVHMHVCVGGRIYVTLHAWRSVRDGM